MKLTVAGCVLAAVAACAPATAANASSPSAGRTATPIKHFVFLMQGGRTFDNYFGAYPGAAGPPAHACQARQVGRPGKGCVAPFPLRARQPPPLGASKTTIERQYDNGQMDGFVSAYERQSRDGASVMGYYGPRELPFYWAAAHSYVLFDHFFSSTLYGIRSNRSYWVSARPAPGGAGAIPRGGYGKQPTIFDRLQAAGVSWKFYVQAYKPEQTYETASPFKPETQTARVPLVDYRRFTTDPALKAHIVDLSQYFWDLEHGTLPAVSYIASSVSDNERSARSIAAGQSLVRNLLTQLMQSRYWDSSALMWSYDGSGGWFDHMRPPLAGGQPLGFRVPALLVSAYARKGQVDHAVLDYTSALKFIEVNWGLAPLTTRDLRARSIASAFDFRAGPRPAAVLPPVKPPAAGAGPGREVADAAGVYGLYGAPAALSALLLVLAAAGPAVLGRRRGGRSRSPGGAG